MALGKEQPLRTINPQRLGASLFRRAFEGVKVGTNWIAFRIEVSS